MVIDSDEAADGNLCPSFAHYCAKNVADLWLSDALPGVWRQDGTSSTAVRLSRGKSLPAI
jgi:hypothetical protein